MIMQIPKKMQQKLDEGRQYRDFSVRDFELRAEGDGEKRVEGYATVFMTPYMLYHEPGWTVMEQIDTRAFDECDMDDVIMQYDHQGRVFARTGNGTLFVSADDVGLKTRAELGGTELGRQVYEEIEGGYTTKMSFGFRVGEEERTVTEDYENNETVVMRTITKIAKLYDVSAVSLPANSATSISARSYGEGVIAEVKEERLAREARERQKAKIRILANI